MKSHPYLLESDAKGTRFEPIQADEVHYNEAWLQEVLRCHPDILPTDEIETVYSPLIPIGREVGTAAGSIDNLFISDRGYLVLVETKLWRNPEARREVLAQAIDYGASLSRWSYNDLDKLTRNYTSIYEGKAMGLIEWAETRFGLLEDGKEYFEDTVSKNLRLGRFLTMIVGDRIRQSLKDMLSYVNKYPHLAMDVALVELNCYRWKQGQDWPLVVVPNLVTRSQVVERSVVQVTLAQTGSYTVEAVQEKAPEQNKGQKRELLTEEAFWELLKVRAPEAHQAARELIEHFRQLDGVEISPSTSSMVIRLDVQDSGEQATIFFLESYGSLVNWPGTTRQQLIRGGVSGSLVDAYAQAVRNILKPTGKWKFSKPVHQVNLPAFIAAVEAFIQAVQSAEPVSS
jgi:hypothetical protein